MDDLKASMTTIEVSQQVHQIVKNYAAAVGMVVNNKKSAIQLDVEAPFPILSKTSLDWTR